jgi:hypothetical protein
MLTEKDYCDYDACVALKELGYPTKMTFVNEFGSIEIPINSGLIQLYEAQKWLREEKDIHIEVYACAGGYIYELCKAYKPNSFSGGTTIYTPNDVDNHKLNDAERYDAFETCLSEGIKEAVKLLKNN